MAAPAAAFSLASAFAIASLCTCPEVVIIVREPEPELRLEIPPPRLPDLDPAIVAAPYHPRELRAPNPPRRPAWHVALRSFS